MYRGVTKTDDGRYEARIFKDAQESRIGVYDSAVDAAIAYDIVAEASLGEFAAPVLNFPDIQEESP